MANVTDRITNESTKKWLEKYAYLRVMNVLIHSLEENGYNLNPESGLWLKAIYTDKEMKKLGHTVINVAFPRPVDLHYHEDVAETIHIMKGNGEGIIYSSTSEKAKIKKMPLFPGEKLHIPKGIPHTFRPNKNDILETRLECSGILNPEKEVCVKKFNEYPPHIDYYKSLRF